MSSESSLHFFMVLPEDAPQGLRPPADVEGDHLWTLPRRIGCPDCTIYSAIGPAYPSIDLSGWPELEALEKSPAASWRQYVELAGRLAQFVGPDVLLSPGTEFGPFRGVVRGGPSDFVLGPIHLLFAAPLALARLGELGIALPPAVPAQLRGRGRTPTELVEFDVPRAGQLALDGYKLRAPEPCATCGHWDRTLERVVLEAGSAPLGIDLMRPLNHPTVVLASERFVSAVREAELTGLRFEPVEIAVGDT